MPRDIIQPTREGHLAHSSRPSTPKARFTKETRNSTNNSEDNYHKQSTSQQFHEDTPHKLRSDREPENRPNHRIDTRDSHNVTERRSDETNTAFDGIQREDDSKVEQKPVKVYNVQEEIPRVELKPVKVYSESKRLEVLYVLFPEMREATLRELLIDFSYNIQAAVEHLLKRKRMQFCETAPTSMYCYYDKAPLQHKLCSCSTDRKYHGHNNHLDNNNVKTSTDTNVTHVNLKTEIADENMSSPNSTLKARKQNEYNGNNTVEE